MAELDVAALQEELEQFRKEKEQIRQIVGAIGGQQSVRHERLVNVGFIAGIIALFALDLVRHVFHWNVPLPALFSIEIGILLVSIKIIWMIHKQAKVEHFQFWILSSIEFRVNWLAKRIGELEELIRSQAAGSTESG